MVVRQSARDRLAPQAHYFNHEIMSKWMVPAGPDHAQIAASNGILDYFDVLMRIMAGQMMQTARDVLKACAVRLKKTIWRHY